MAGFFQARRVRKSEVRPKLTGNGILWSVHSFCASCPQPRVVLAFKHWWADFTTEDPSMTDTLKAYYSLGAADTVKVWFLSSNTSVKILGDVGPPFRHRVTDRNLLCPWLESCWGGRYDIARSRRRSAAHRETSNVDDAHGGKQKFMQSGADLFFVIFMLLFTVMSWSLSVRSLECTCGGQRIFFIWVCAWTCIALLYILLCSKYIGSVLIMKVAIKVITSGAAEDVRSDEDDEDSGSTLKKNK